MGERPAEQTITRRRLVGSGLAAGAGLALGPLSDALAHRRAHHHRHRRRVDVAVIGAGLAGLTAARHIAHAGRSVVVLEARHRVGGRVLNHHLGHGVFSEGGATFVGPTQDRILALAKKLGVKKFPTYDTGDDLYISPDGERFTYSDTGPTGTAPPDPAILPDLALVVLGLDEMSKSVPVDAPWEAEKAAEWDRQSVKDYFDSRPLVNPHEFKALIPLATRPIFGAEPRELSLLFVLFYIAASGNQRNTGTFERNFDTRHGAQKWRFHGGSQLIAERLAKRLGRRVVLHSPVRRIERHRSGVRVVSDRLDVHARQAIVAVPPVVAAAIRYEPDLPRDRARLNRLLHQGTLIKASAVYEKPFWRDAGLTGQAFTTGGPVNATFDDSPPDGKPGIVFGFIGGDNARAHRKLSRRERRRKVLDQYAEFFGPKARHPIDYFETDWKRSQWTRGCPVGIARPGLLTAYGRALRKPVGGIHWAGTETSTYWNGYMDGAVRSGERAAQEVIDEL